MSHPGRSWPDRFRPLWWLANRLESIQLRYLGTSGIALVRRTPVLLLETTGRRSGRRHWSGVAYWRGDGTYLIGGGAGGMTRVDWVANLRANPRAAAWVSRRRIPVTARELNGEQYDAARAEAFRRWPGAPKYEVRSGRSIPYFELRPVAEERASR